jgi:hypothetical protein
MALIPFAVLWFAYQLGWYGFTTIYPVCGVGFTDLILPNRIGTVDGMLAQSIGAGGHSGDKSSNCTQTGSGGSGGGGGGSGGAAGLPNVPGVTGPEFPQVQTPSWLPGWVTKIPGVTGPEIPGLPGIFKK